MKRRFWLLLAAFAFARFIEVVPIVRDRVKNSTGPVALGSRRETAPFCWLAAGAYAGLSMNSIGVPGLLIELNEGLRFRFKV